MKNDTAWAAERAREMLAVGINVQATGAATNEIVTAIIKSLLDHIDGFEAVAETHRTALDNNDLLHGISSDPPSSAEERMREALDGLIAAVECECYLDDKSIAFRNRLNEAKRAALSLQGPSGKTGGEG